MSNYKLDKYVRYAETHEWVRMEADIAVVGISDAAQDMLSDIVYVELPEVGQEVKAGEAVAVVESVKAAEEVLAPVSGTVTEINEAIVDEPELVNSEPYSSWFFKLEPSDHIQSELDALLDPQAYDKFVDETAH